MKQKNKRIFCGFFKGKYRKSLTGEMMLLLCKSMVIAVFFFALFYFGSKTILDFYFEDSDYLKRVENKRIEEFQKYITQNNISTKDTTLLTDWIHERNIPLVTISRKRELLYDSTYMARTPIGKTDADYLHKSWQYFHTVEFADGTADVLIYEGYEEKYYISVLVLSILLSVVVMLIIFVQGMKKRVIYIKALKEEIDMIGGGCLTHSIVIQGEDELAGLADGLNKMRMSLLETQEMEEKLRIAEEELVTGMSHDLRTPLTGLMTYLEIMRKQDENGEKIERKYIEKSFDKAVQMRTLSNQMFEYFLAKREQNILLNPPADWQSVTGDYLSEFVCSMQKAGLVVEYKNPGDVCAKIAINDDFWGRIFDNIISNFEKYADPSIPVKLNILFEEKWFGIRIENKIIDDWKEKRGNNIGMKNVCFMMKKMNGQCETQIHDGKYIVILWLPIKSEII